MCTYSENSRRTVVHRQVLTPRISPVVVGEGQKRLLIYIIRNPSRSLDSSVG